MKRLTCKLFPILGVLFLCLCKTNFKISENKLLEYEKCRIYEKEIILAVEYDGSGKNDDLATFNMFEIKEELVFQIDEDISNLEAEDLPTLYKNAIFTRILFIENENLRLNCPELKYLIRIRLKKIL